MPKKRETEPQIHIDDLHPKQEGFVQSYQASWQETGVIATLWLDVVDRDHWQPGHYLPHAYELISHLETVSGRPLGPIQEETGFLILQELRAQMLAAMTDAGWQQVDSTREGRPIYQYRPGPRLSRRPAAPAAKIESDLPDLAPAGAGAGDEQLHLVVLERGDAPVITIDDLSQPPMTEERKQQHLGPLFYQAEAVQGDVKAQIHIRRYGDPRYPGGYLLHTFFLRTNENAPGRMGYKQVARARALLATLEKRVETALFAAGWVKRWKSPQDADLWVYVGTTGQPAADPAVSERDLPDIALTEAGTEVPGEDQAHQLEFVLIDQLELEPRQSHMVEVIGSDEAKERGQQPAYSREVWTRPVSFTCVVCKTTVTQQRYPGHTPLYCSDACKDERKREKTRERVARHREKKKAEAGENKPPHLGTEKIL